MRADKHSAFHARLLPALRGAVEGVDDSVGCYAENGVDRGEIALEDGKVEFGVCARRRGRVVVMYGCSIGFVV